MLPRVPKFGDSVEDFGILLCFGPTLNLPELPPAATVLGRKAHMACGF